VPPIEKHLTGFVRKKGDRVERLSALRNYPEFTGLIDNGVVIFIGEKVKTA